MPARKPRGGGSTPVAAVMDRQEAAERAEEAEAREREERERKERSETELIQGRPKPGSGKSSSTKGRRAGSTAEEEEESGRGGDLEIWGRGRKI